MITDENFSRLDKTDAELEESLIFWCAVAGKNADSIAHKVEYFLQHLLMPMNPLGLERSRHPMSPFDSLRLAIKNEEQGMQRWWWIGACLRQAKLGKYALLERCYRAIVDLNPRTCTLDELEAVPGIGPKTARCFILHSRADARVAGLDTHILKALRAWGYDAPRATPTGRRYRELEAIVLNEADARGLSPRDLDAQLWLHYAGRRPSPHLLEPRQSIATHV